MDAFWSGTDDANENMTQFYGVWGKVNLEKPKFLFRWVSGTSKVNINHSLLFETPTIKKEVITRITGQDGEVSESVVETIENYDGPIESVEYPSDWMAQHTPNVYSYKANDKSKNKRNTHGLYGNPYYKEYDGYFLEDEYQIHDQYDEYDDYDRLAGLKNAYYQQSLYQSKPNYVKEVVQEEPKNNKKKVTGKIYNNYLKENRKQNEGTNDFLPYKK